MSESTTIETPTTGAAAVSPAAPSGAAPATTGVDAGASSWRDTLPADLREAPSLASLGDVTALAKAHVEAQALIGRKGLIVPKAEDPPAVHAAYRAALGVPEKPEDYALAAPEGIPEGVWNADGAAAFAAEAHKHGLTPAQAQGLAAWWAQTEAGKAQAAAQGIEADGRPMETHLREEWGAAYDAKVEAAKRAAKDFGASPAILDALEAKVGGAEMLRFFAKLGEATGEDRPAGMGTGRAGGGDPKAELDRLMAPGGPYWQPLHPDHHATYQRVKALHEAMAQRAAA